MKNFMCVLFTLLCIFTATTSAAEPESPIFELRIYTTHPGKMPNLLTRFENHTLKIFERHGMENVGYWLPVGQESENKLYYILKHKSRAAAEASWQAFGADPEWKKVSTASEANGPIVAGVESIFMTPAEFSRIK